MSDPLQTAPAAAADPPSEARAARLAKFQREQLIVDYLNRGVSVAEIAARIGVGGKRMRAIIREILNRRMPAAPEEFAAIQMSRLNEALLVAFSAMSTTNLKAVDQVIRIVRELERYRGFCVAERRRPETSRIPGGLDEGLALECAEDPDLADLDFAPDAFACADPEPAAPGPAVMAASAQPQETERVESRPENPAQDLESVQFAPGIEVPDAPAPVGRPASEAAPPGLLATLAKDAFSNGSHAALARLRDALTVARGEGRTSRPFDRPENPLQSVDNAQFAPGAFGRLAGAASGAASAGL